MKNKEACIKEQIASMTFQVYLRIYLSCSDLKTSKTNTESDLVIKLKNGDSKAFDTLFANYGKRLYYFTYAYLKSKEEAEGVVQEVFLRIWRNRKKLKPDLSFKAYLFKITYHCILAIFKQNSSRHLYLHSIANDTVHFTEEMNERLNYQMLLEKVDSLIEQLPPRQKEILIKRKKEDLPVKEIAHQLEISPKTVENHLTEALKKIRKGLGDNNIESMFL